MYICVLFCSVLFSAFLASRVGLIMHDVPPTSSVLRHSYQVLLCSSGPCSYIIHPVDPRSSFSPSSRNCALNDLFFQACSLLSHDVFPSISFFFLLLSLVTSFLLLLF